MQRETAGFLVAAGSEAMQARAQGVDVIAVGAYYKAFPVNIIVLGSSPIQKLADLKGSSLGVPGRYGESWFAVQAALQTAGLTEKDVTIVEVGYTQVAALTTAHIVALDSADIKALSTAQIAALTTAQLAAMETADFAAARTRVATMPILNSSATHRAAPVRR